MHMHIICVYVLCIFLKQTLDVDYLFDLILSNLILSCLIDSDLNLI